jgi:endogenous inhibitor of DNA gyrase (YacG/DUF329 family)
MKCPICKKQVDATSAGKPGSFFPFCSDRCKLVDLGRWLDGAYQIPIDTHDDEAQDEAKIDPLIDRKSPRRRRD